MRDTLAVLRNRNMSLLLSGRIVSELGDAAYGIALMIAIYQYSHGKTFLVGIFWLVRLVPPLLLGPFAGALADRIGYRRAMLIADAGRFVLVLILALTLTPSTWGAIFPIAFLVVAGNTLFNPASVGLVPSLVPDGGERLAANAAIMQANSLAIIAGSALGAAVGILGFRTLLLIDAGTFAVSAITLLLINRRAAVEPAEGAEMEEESVETPGGILSGFRLVGSRPLLVFAVTIMALPELASGAIVVWFVPYSEQLLRLGSEGVGYLYLAVGLGGLVGGFVAAALGSNFRLNYLLAASVVVGGAAVALFSVVQVALAALAFALVLGLAQTVEYAAFETLLQQSVPGNMIGRASGSINSFLFNMVLVGNVASGFVSAWLGLPVAFAGLGILVVVVTAAGWWYLQSRTAGQPTAEALARIPAFAGVSSAVRDWAVRRMIREQFAAGATVIRQGDVGDKFYTIARGTARVDVRGEGETVTAEMGPGDFFGEIALLQNVPRTATVSAVTPLVVWALSRDDFEELQRRAGEFSESLWEVATARLAQSPNMRMKMANPSS